MLTDAECQQTWDELKDTALVKAWPDFQHGFLPRLVRVAKAPGEWVFREGDRPSDFYIVGSGSLQETVSREGRPWLRRSLGLGGFTGQQALYFNQSQSEVRATSPSILYRMQPSDLRMAMERSTTLHEMLLREETTSRLRRQPLLRSLTDDEIRAVAWWYEEQELAEGAPVPLADKPGLWIIDWGQIEVTGSAALGRAVRRLSTGCFFFSPGREGRAGATLVAATATARLKTHLYQLPAGSIDAMVAVLPDMARLLRKPPDLAQSFGSVTWLNDLTDEQRQHLAEFSGWFFVPSGQNITTQGQPGYGLVMIRDGAALVTSLDDRGRSRPRNYLHAPASYGETSLLQGKEHDATARAVRSPAASDGSTLEGTDIVILDRRDLQIAFSDRPELWGPDASLVTRFKQIKEQTRPYDWMQEGERLHWRGRSHWLWLLMPELSVLSVLLVLVSLTLITMGSSPELGATVGLFTLLITCLILIPVAVLIAYNYLDDYYAVTNRRVTRRDHLILVFESRIESPLEMVQDVTFDAGFWGRLLDYGDVTIRSAAKIGAIRFQRVPEPDKVRQIIREEKAEASAGARGQQHERLRRDVMAGLHLALAIPEPGRALGDKAQPPARRSWRARLRPSPHPAVVPGGRTGTSPLLTHLAAKFPERWRKVLIGNAPQEIQIKAGEFLWRKHPIQLAFQAGPPLVIALLWSAIGLLIFTTDLSGLGINPAAVDLPWGLVSAVLLGWIWWEYEDYRNDIYIVTDDRIIDIEATPLWLSMKRREGGLDRVQNVGITQKGLIQNILNYGNVEIQTAATDEGYNFLLVSNPKLVQAIIFQKLDAFKGRQAERQMRDRQREMIEGLDVYHELRREGRGF
jgi:CRP-like cAMP-binding protein/membrane protein YdbS with pleckstrin-like domain